MDIVYMNKLHDEICRLVELSLKNKRYSEQISFPLSNKTIETAWKYYFIDLRNYICVIHSDEIRHVEKEHGHEVQHICKIPDYLDKFIKIERSTTRDKATGKNIPCFVFTKNKSPKNIKMVKVHISKNKILRLKTMYEA